MTQQQTVVDKPEENKRWFEILLEVAMGIRDQYGRLRFKDSYRFSQLLIALASELNSVLKPLLAIEDVPQDRRKDVLHVIVHIMNTVVFSTWERPHIDKLHALYHASMSQD